MEMLAQAMPAASRARIDFSVFSDAELERLAGYAERRLAWPGKDWLRNGIVLHEREDLDELQVKLGKCVDHN
jgi:hypothetical protein